MGGAPGWSEDEEALAALQRELAELAEGVPPWRPRSAQGLAVGGVFVTVPTGKAGRQAGPGDPAWAAAAVLEGGRLRSTSVVGGSVSGRYEPGYLALQVGPILEEAVRALDRPPEVLLVNATGRDHPRRAGLALHLGAVLDLPTVGVTDRPLLASGPQPDRARGSASPLVLEGEVVGFLFRSRRRARPIAVHAAWRTDPDTALQVVQSVCLRARTPEPLRQARRLAREARARAEGRLR
ncbi:MAG TPA: endonuclease V [Actinomycetota bacterium]|nr:endonuclease V [Actinomycetota bacterium]